MPPGRMALIMLIVALVLLLLHKPLVVLLLHLQQCGASPCEQLCVALTACRLQCVSDLIMLHVIVTTPEFMAVACAA